ncbi:MAG: hypothetical protein JOZ81_12020 [Chloroflexi bacterium]|nr:hypothetical protein [Chloroflexota bacterium]MBV9545170.1 hypothetical protein [Chloroflexota bacterium]
MRQFVRLGVVSSCIGVAALLGSVAPAFADLGPKAVYEIESKEQYCADGSQNCVAQHDLSRLRFALFEAYRLNTVTGMPENTAHASAARPDVILAKCAGPHSMDSRGNIHAPTMFVQVGPSNQQGLDPGTISGTVSLRHGLESDTASTATLALEVADSTTADAAVITGQQVTNNVSDTWVSGGFYITLRGPIYDEVVAGPDANESAMPARTGSTGTMTCSTGNPTVTVPGAPPPYFESELDDVFDPTS